MKTFALAVSTTSVNTTMPEAEKKNTNPSCVVERSVTLTAFFFKKFFLLILYCFKEK
jgi:hypothetical protein